MVGGRNRALPKGSLSPESVLDTERQTVTCQGGSFQPWFWRISREILWVAVNCSLSLSRKFVSLSDLCVLLLLRLPVRPWGPASLLLGTWTIIHACEADGGSGLYLVTHTFQGCSLGHDSRAASWAWGPWVLSLITQAPKFSLQSFLLRRPVSNPWHWVRHKVLLVLEKTDSYPHHSSISNNSYYLLTICCVWDIVVYCKYLLSYS